MKPRFCVAIASLALLTLPALTFAQDPEASAQDPLTQPLTSPSQTSSSQPTDQDLAQMYNLGTPLFLANTTQPSDSSNKYGPFSLFDHRSLFGTGFFPEPFLVDEGDLDNEIAFSWIHQEGHSTISDQYTGEVEFSLGLTTIEIESSYERDSAPVFNPGTGLSPIEATEGMDAVEVTVRHPLWQWVSDDEQIDNTVAVGFELAIPTGSAVGKDTELVPEIFDLLRIGDHFGLQTHVGYSTLTGTDPGNEQTLEYSADFSYMIDRSIMPLPKGVAAFVPMFELAGERGLNAGDFSDHLDGLIGFRVNLDSIGPLNPRLGIGYIFPVDKQARGDFDWGIATSLVFDL